MCCKVDRNTVQKLAYRFQLVDTEYPLKFHILTLLRSWWRFYVLPVFFWVVLQYVCITLNGYHALCVQHPANARPF